MLDLKKLRMVTNFFKDKKIINLKKKLVYNNFFFPDQCGPMITLASTWSYLWMRVFRGLQEYMVILRIQERQKT